MHVLCAYAAVLKLLLLDINSVLSSPGQDPHNDAMA